MQSEETNHETVWSQLVRKNQHIISIKGGPGCVGWGDMTSLTGSCNSVPEFHWVYWMMNACTYINEQSKVSLWWYTSLSVWPPDTPNTSLIAILCSEVCMLPFTVCAVLFQTSLLFLQQYCGPACVLCVCGCVRKMHETCWQVINWAKASHLGHDHKVTLAGGGGCDSDYPSLGACCDCIASVSLSSLTWTSRSPSTHLRWRPPPFRWFCFLGFWNILLTKHAKHV